MLNRIPVNHWCVGQSEKRGVREPCGRKLFFCLDFLFTFYHRGGGPLEKVKAKRLERYSERH